MLLVVQYFRLNCTANMRVLLKIMGMLNSDINGQLSCLSYYKEATLAYIGGFIVGKSLSCEECSGALVTNNKTIDFLSLVKFKDRGGLIYPSADVLKILKVCEIVFQTNISGDNFKEPWQFKISFEKQSVTRYATQYIVYFS